ncbi:hypothetical protein GGX14DRAFT_626418 [Mycena pura]|uniref:Uncharacterized protein n=1 Tax=Mycena pura TaxID=153505 RepID=A0AAD6VDS2_9AGAR|nr:hypothetical protein GGX14DRAFT_626418 [Mycena pura]
MARAVPALKRVARRVEFTTSSPKLLTYLTPGTFPGGLENYADSVRASEEINHSLSTAKVNGRVLPSSSTSKLGFGPPDPYHDRAVTASHPLPLRSSRLPTARGFGTSLLSTSQTAVWGHLCLEVLLLQNCYTIRGTSTSSIAAAFRAEAYCCSGFGFFDNASQLCQRTRDLIIDVTPPGHFRAIALLMRDVSVHINLDAAKPQYMAPMLAWTWDCVDAALMLREGDTVAARAALERVFMKSPNWVDIRLCLERLANLDNGMSKDKLSTMKALKCLCQIAAAEGETSTAMSLLQVAFEGFTFMDVHQWKADCMMRMSKIYLASGDVLRAKELLEAA